MRNAALTFAFASAVAASPMALPPLPPQSLEQGYNLIVNVTDPACDFKDTPVHGKAIIGIHSGAGTNQLTVNDGKTFDKAGYYGTTGQSTHAAITGPVPFGFFTSDKPTEDNRYGLSVSIGNGTRGFGSWNSEQTRELPCARFHGVRLGTFVVCDTKINAPEHARLEVSFFEGKAEDVPQDCVAVSLLPECSPLDLSEATYYHGDVIKSQCYTEKVSTIDWSKYQACQE